MFQTTYPYKFVILFMFLSFSCATEENDLYVEQLQEIARLKTLYQELEGKYDRELLSDQIVISDLKLMNMEGDEVNLRDVLKTDYTLLFYFSKNSCSPCIDDYLQFLSTFYEKKKEENIIIVSNYENTRPMIVKKNAHHSKIPHFISRDVIDIPMNSSDRIAFFVLLSKDLRINFPRYALVQDSIKHLYFDKVFSFKNEKIHRKYTQKK